jgi:hypothetical protein
MRTALFGVIFSGAMAGVAYGAGNAEWKGAMSELATSLFRMIPALSSQDPPDEKTALELLNFSKDLSRMAHKVGGMKRRPNSDPAMAFVFREFRQDLEGASQALEKGDGIGGRRRLREVTRYCIGCHSMHEAMQEATYEGKMNGGAGRLPDYMIGLSDIQRAEIYAATRQFDLAIIHFEKALTKPAWARQHPVEWNDAVQKLLSIVVRVRNSPGLSLEMVSRFFDTESYPRELSAAARLWRSHIKEWRRESKSSELQLDRASNLIDRAEILRKKQNPHSGFILYLRASSILHQIMAHPARGMKTDRMLYLAGLAAEGMAQTNFWTLPGDFFKACIRESRDPSGEWAVKCRSHLKASESSERRI